MKLLKQNFKKPMKMKKAKLKSKIPVESFRRVLTDDIYDINNDEFDSTTVPLEKILKTTNKNDFPEIQNQKASGTPNTKHESKDIVSESALRRSKRLKSEVFDERNQNDVFGCGDGITTEPLDKLETNNETETKKLKRKICETLDKKDVTLDIQTGNNNPQKRLFKNDAHLQEMAENMIATIDTNAIVSMLSLVTETELKNQNSSKRKRTHTEGSDALFDKSPKKSDEYVNRIERSKGNTENCNMLSGKQMSLKKLDNVLAKTKMVSAHVKTQNNTLNDSSSSQLSETASSGKTFGKIIQSSTKTISQERRKKNPMVSAKTKMVSAHVKAKKNILNDSSSYNTAQASGDEESVGKSKSSLIKTINLETPEKDQSLVNNKDDFLENSVEEPMQTKKKSINKNSILEYFSVQTKRRDNLSKSPEMSVREIQSSERALDSASNSANMEVSEVTDKTIAALKEPNNLNKNQIDNQTPDKNKNLKASKRGRQPAKRKQNCSQTPDKNDCNQTPDKNESLEAKKRDGPTATTNKQMSRQTLYKNTALEPKKRGRPPFAKQLVHKINLCKLPGTKKYTKISKLTKEQIKNVSMRKIPKDRLEDVMKILNEDDHPIWDDRNTSCNPYIFFHWNPSSSVNSDQNIKLKYARQFLLRRDWISLSKVLCLSNVAAKSYYPLLVKYASLLLAHTEKEQFNKFIQSLTSFNDSSIVMKACTKIPTQNEE